MAGEVVWSGGGSVQVACITGTGSRRWTQCQWVLYEQLGHRLWPVTFARCGLATCLGRSADKRGMYLGGA
jgi:hypothetical protein